MSTLLNTSLPCKGDGKTLGLTNDSTNYGLQIQTGGDTRCLFRTDLYNKSVGQTANNNNLATAYKSAGITTDASKSGIVCDASSMQLDTFKPTNFIIKY